MSAEDLKAAVREYLSEQYPDGPACKCAAVVIQFVDGFTPETLLVTLPAAPSTLLRSPAEPACS
ncbi:MAG TPA: hypothetical protein VM529_18050 [Gemmata sp.]|nr:hypothetical protein [Gemmata sp.]